MYWVLSLQPDVMFLFMLKSNVILHTNYTRQTHNKNTCVRSLSCKSTDCDMWPVKLQGSWRQISQNQLRRHSFAAHSSPAVCPISDWWVTLVTERYIMCMFFQRLRVSQCKMKVSFSRVFCFHSEGVTTMNYLWCPKMKECHCSGMWEQSTMGTERISCGVKPV